MTDKQDQNDEIRSMSRKFEAITTTDKNLNSHERPRGNNQSSSSLNEEIIRTQTPENLPTPTIHKNIPERIIFIVDTVKENDCTPFEIGTGVKISPLHMIKRVIEMFINAKGTINKKHEYAIMKLTDDSAHWICNFTDNPKCLVNCLERIEEILVDENCEKYDLAECFDIIDKKIELDYSLKIPETLTRVILIYSRSRCIPYFSDTKNFRVLMENLHFFTDVAYVHEHPTEDNACEEIYEKLGELDVKQNSYIYEVARNAAALHNTMGKLLAHPLQRPKQNETSYTAFRVYEEVGEVQTNV